jgi:hypothetical protein
VPSVSSYDTPACSSLGANHDLDSSGAAWENLPELDPLTK